MKVLKVIESPFSVTALIFNKEVVVKEATKELTIKRLRKLDDYLLSIEDVEADVNQVLLEQCPKPVSAPSPQPIVTTVSSSIVEPSQPSSLSTS